MSLFWKPFQLTSALRPVLNDQEIEIYIVSNVSLYFGTVKTYQNGTATITTHRVLYFVEPPKGTTTATALALTLGDINSIDSKPGFIGLSSPKIRLVLGAPNTPNSNNNNSNPTPNVPTSNSRVSLSMDSCMLSFHGNERDTFYAKLQDSIQSKVWLLVEKKKEVSKNEFSTSSAGIKGIIRKKERDMKEEEKLTDSIKDLSQLMENAGEIVKLTEKYVNSKEGKTGGTEEQAQFNSLLQNMGIASPVTKEAAGTSYHVQLSRQLADFIKEPLRKSGGMMSLTDVYCIFNRARGTELISPHDLRQACAMFSTLRLPLRFRTFPSGLLVIENEGHSDEKVFDNIVATIKKRGPVTALDLCEIMGTGWTLLIAKQHLDNAEKAEFIVRDHSIEGLRFYENLFKNFITQKK